MKGCVKCGEDDLDKFEVNKVVSKSCHRQYNSSQARQARIDKRVAEIRAKNQITT